MFEDRVMHKLLLMLGLSLCFARALLAANGPAYWSRMDAEAHGNLGQMLQVIESSKPRPQLRPELGQMLFATRRERLLVS